MNRPTKYAWWVISSCLTFIMGGLLNDVVLMFNDGMMPVFLGHLWREPFVLDASHVAMTAGAHLKIFCDIIPVGNIIASFGDVLLMTGLISLCACLFSIWISMWLKWRKKKV